MSPSASPVFTNFAELNNKNDDDHGGQPGNCSLHFVPSNENNGDGGDDRENRNNGDSHTQSSKGHDQGKGDGHGSSQVQPTIVPSGTPFFGPQTYVRARNGEDEFTSAVIVPSSVTQPFFLHLVNGDANGNYRVSSGSVAIDGKTVLSQSSFSQNLVSADCAVTLSSRSSLQVALESKPGSFLSITLLGKNADRTPPVVTILAPVTGAVINTPQTHFDVRYQDLQGAGER